MNILNNIYQDGGMEIEWDISSHTKNISACMEIEEQAVKSCVYNVYRINNNDNYIDKRKEKSLNEVVLKVMSWNVRSLNKVSKLRRIGVIDADITLLQEVWAPSEISVDLLGSNKLINVRKNEVGGGTIMLWRDEALVQANLEKFLNKDSLIAKFVIAGNRFVWMSSTYINRGSKKNFLDVMANVKELVPEVEWPYVLLCGDWNIHANDEQDLSEGKERREKRIDAVTKICKQMGLDVVTGGPTRKGAILDFVIAGSAIRVFDLKVAKSDDISDHDILTFNISVKMPDVSLRTVYLPNKKLADKFTMNSLQKAASSGEFMNLIQRRLKSRNMNICSKVKRKPFKRELLDKLLFSASDDEELASVISEYWREKANENETNRFSGRIKEAFKFLKTVFKYHEYDRRDGSIISRILGNEGEVICDPGEVNRRVLQNLKTLQTKDDELVYMQPEPFPTLNELTTQEMEKILNTLSTNKAVAYDGLSDIMFEGKWKKLAVIKLRDLWDVLAAGHEIHPIHFEARLVPLNKVHPRLPRASDCRPIIVTSPFVKLLEARLKGKLDDYMMKKLHCSQVGFVPHNGISVNHLRLLDRVGYRTRMGSRAFGLFIDFSNAYNTILHSKLYERLERVLSAEEIGLIKALYSRTRIKLGDETFAPNIGVAQGSMISPGLFNIYCEELYYLLENDVGIHLEDLLGYADDMLIICSSLTQLRRVVETIREWSSDNNLKLNESKSGIIEFLPRLGRQSSVLKVGSLFAGIPVVEKYKYLGMWVNSKLTMDLQLEYIKEKAQYLVYKLWPLLKNVPLDYRINLWTVLVRPMFEMLTCMYVREPPSNQEKTNTVLRGTFKKFALLGKNVKDSTVGALMDFDFGKRASLVVELCRNKWDSRKLRIIPKYHASSHSPKASIRWPKELQILLNLKSALCPQCKKPCGEYHMLNHNIFIPSDETLITNIKEINSANKKKGRTYILKSTVEYLRPFIDVLHKHLNCM